MKKTAFVSLMLLCGMTSAYADAGNMQDMEKYIQQCPDAVADREAMKPLTDSLKQPEKTGDENQDIINTCKYMQIYKEKFVPAYNKYVKDLDYCSKHDLPILKMTVNNLRLLIQQVPFAQAEAMCN